MKNKTLLGILTASALVLGSAAYAEGDNMTFAEQQQIYKTASESVFQPSFENTATVRAPHRNLVKGSATAPAPRPDPANSTEGM
jgi:hypothetical protein